MKHPLSGKKILISNVPLDGHFNPLVDLVKYLRDIGCELRWYTSEIFSKKLEALDVPHEKFNKAAEINSKSLTAMIPELKTANGPEKGKYYLKNLFIDRAAEYFEDIKLIYEDFKFDLFIADSMFSAMPLIRYHLKIPVIAIGVIPLMEDSVDTAPAGQALPPAENDAIRLAYSKMYIQKYTNLGPLISLYKSELSSYEVSVRGSFIFDTLIKEANLYLQIGVPGFEYKRSDIGANIRFIGSMLPTAEARIKPVWFDERLTKYEKVVLVTQGTVETDYSKLLEPTLKAFIHTNTLVVVTTGGNGTDILRNKYVADNVIIEDFIPFSDIMPYATVFVTNGGYGGTIKSIMSGVPMVAAGVYELKNEICARIEFFGLGFDLKTEKPAPEAIHQSVQQIMVNDYYKTQVEKLREEMHRYDSLQLCSDYIGKLIGEDALKDVES